MNWMKKEENFQIFLNNLIIYLEKCKNENINNILIAHFTINLMMLCVLKRNLKFIQLEKRMTEKN
jgi:hypothetical protein